MALSTERKLDLAEVDTIHVVRSRKQLVLNQLGVTTSRQDKLECGIDPVACGQVI